MLLVYPNFVAELVTLIRQDTAHNHRGIKRFQKHLPAPYTMEIE